MIAKKITYAIVGLLLLAGIYYFLSQPLKYVIEGPIDTQSALLLLDSADDTSSRVGIDKSQLSNSLRTIVPPQRQIRITHTFMTRTVHIEIASAEPAFRWQSRGVVYTGDDGGVVSSAKEEDASLPLVIDAENTEVVVGSQVLPVETVAFIEVLQAESANRIEKPIKNFIITDSSRTVRVLLEDPEIEALFDSTRQPEPQLDSLAKILKKQKAGELSVTSYVDLRIAGRAYIK